MIDIEAAMEQMRREQTLTCPYCGYEIDPSDIPDDLVTYWGGDGHHKEECLCPECEAEFTASETVLRTYESFKVDGDEQ